MKAFWVASFWFVATAFGQAPASAPETEKEPVAVFAEHPRLFLRPARLRLLRRERERSSPRWQQLEALVRGGAPLPEPGFSKALYFQIAQDPAVGRQAVDWALKEGQDLRQLSIVFDWCRDLMSEDQSRSLAAKIAGKLAAPPDNSVAGTRSRALAAIALYDHVPDVPQRELERVVRQWWEAGIAAALNSGRDAISDNDALPLYELFHAIRDSTNLDLREDSREVFTSFPIERLMIYYPQSYESPENDFRIPFQTNAATPDLKQAALSRAADLAIVAFDTNSEQSQTLQGWLMHDPFMLRGALGAPYEFLWANPYQPGLTYYHIAPVFHDPNLGKLFVRSSWEEGAAWIGYASGVFQKFENGKMTPLDKRSANPLRLDTAVILGGVPDARQMRVRVDEGQGVFLVGLEPRRVYQVEIDDEEMYEVAADPGGILALDLPDGKETGVRLKAR
jgi:hypothetical protein